MNVGKKVTGKKVTEIKSQIWVGKKVTGKKVTNIKSFFFYVMLEMDIIIFIITDTVLLKQFLLGMVFYVLIVNVQSCRHGANASRVLN